MKKDEVFLPALRYMQNAYKCNWHGGCSPPCANLTYRETSGSHSRDPRLHPASTGSDQ